MFIGRNLITLIGALAGEDFVIKILLPIDAGDAPLKLLHGTIVTIIVLAVWAYLAITGTVNADAVNNVTLTVIAFYFGTQHERQGAE